MIHNLSNNPFISEFERCLYCPKSRFQISIFSILILFNFFTLDHTFSTILLICLFLHSVITILNLPEEILFIVAFLV